MRPLLLALLAFATPFAFAQKAPPPTVAPSAIIVTVNMTGSPMTGTCGYSMNLSWTAQNASVCTKSGSWSGSGLPASGSEVVSVGVSPSTYTLQCSSSTDSRQLTWVNPTLNTDGTAASLSGNKIFHSNTSGGVESATAIVLTPQRTSYMLSGLPAGMRYVGAKATSTAGVDSLMSGIASVQITLPVGSSTVQATCTPPPEPRPPTGVTIANAVWDTVSNGTRVGRDVGTIPLEVTCLGEKALITQGTAEYWAVPRDQVTLYRKPRSARLLGRCETVKPS